MFTFHHTDNSTHRPDAHRASAQAGGRGRRRALFAIAIAATAPAMLGACGDDGAAAHDGVLHVDLQDFSFGDLPDEVPAGTRLAVTNQAEHELHELVAFRLSDGDDRPADDIVHHGLDELMTSGPPAAVLLAAPGGEQITAVGDGTLTKPGRYLILCAIPTGADPDEYLAAAATSDGPPQVAGGEPHFAHGMYDDLVVTG